jgi:isocitrate/isopropylmalate dehydrogenase
MSDGMFLTACRAVAKDYPDVKYTEDLLDRVCLRIASDPAPFAERVMVMPNLYVIFWPGTIRSVQNGLLRNPASATP